MLLYLVQGYGKFFFQGVVVDHCGLFFSSKVDQMQDIVTGNPAVIKIVVHFNRWIIENVLALFLASTLWFPAGLLAVHYLYKIVYSNIDVWKYECSTYAATIPSWLMKRSVFLIPAFVPVEFLLPHCFKCEFVLSMFYPSFIQRTEGSEFTAWAAAAISWRCS